MGMLAAWFRMRYPSHVDGAIAASAPIWGLAHTGPAIDGAAAWLTISATELGGASPWCVPNLKAAWVLILDVAETSSGRAMIAESMGLCSPLRSWADAISLVQYLQGPLFNIAESSYPFPSDYITYATFNKSTVPLPAWPMQKLCESLGSDFGVRVVGDTSQVQFMVQAGAVEVSVDWDRVGSNNYSIES